MARSDAKQHHGVIGVMAISSQTNAKRQTTCPCRLHAKARVLQQPPLAALWQTRKAPQVGVSQVIVNCRRCSVELGGLLASCC
jgi:hypothetical protein